MQKKWVSILIRGHGYFAGILILKYLLNGFIICVALNLSWQLTCGICFDCHSRDQIHSAICGHPYCTTCWEGWIYYGLSSFSLTIFVILVMDIFIECSSSPMPYPKILVVPAIGTDLKRQVVGLDKKSFP